MEGGLVTRGWREYAGLVAALALLVAVFGLATDHFLTAATFATIANQVPSAVLVAVGMTFVLVVGGIDLSVGSVLGLSGAVLGAVLVDLRLPLPLALAACLATGLACGALSGLVTVRWALPSFIVTLGMLEIARGAAYAVSGSQTAYLGSHLEWVAEGSLLGLSLPAALALAVVGVGQLVLSRTVFGRYMLAVGANEEAVRLSGIDPRPVKGAVFATSGLLSALAAVLYCARLASADPNAGIGLELQAIAAVVIGGTSLMGGRGSVVHSFLGVLVIAVLGSGLAQMGAPEPMKRLITGCVIVAAVVVDRHRHRGAAPGGA
jgi:ribose transport system permease protein